jgi:hypothetical protein
VLFVNYVVIVCLFVSRRLDNYESKEDESRSQPRNEYGDYSTQVENEDFYKIAKPDKPSLDHSN